MESSIISGNFYSVIVLENIHGEITEQIQKWCSTNCTQRWDGFYTSWIFANKDDAFLFKLTWC